MKKFSLMKNFWWLGLVLISVIFFLLRLIKIDNLPIFVDEAIYVRWAQVMRAEETLRFLPLSDGKQPFYMWALIPFLKFWENPLVAGRILSVVSGFGTLIGVILVSLTLFKSKKVTLITAFLYTISPYSVFFDKMALVDSMLSFFGIWTFFFAVKTLETKRLDLAMITGFFLGGAFLTKSPALFFVLLLPTIFILEKWPKDVKKVVLNFGKLVLLFIPTLVIGYGLYNILRLGPNFHLIASRNLDYVFPLSHLWLNPKDPFMFLVPKGLDWIWKMAPFSILILALTSIAINLKKHTSQIVVLTAWFIVPFLAQSMFAKVFTARYIYFLIPFLFILAGASFLVKEKIIKIGIWTVTLLGIIVSFRFNYYLLTDISKANLPRSERSGYLEEWSAGQGIAEVADYMVELYNQKPQKIVVGTEGYFGTLPDGLQAYLNSYPEIIVIGIGLNFETLPTPLYESKVSGNPTYLVVNSTRFNRDSSELGLTLISSFPKAQRPDGTTESLLLFEVQDEEYLNLAQKD